MNKWNRVLKIAKIDKEEQMVYGYASTDDLDSDGEIIKVDALAKALPEYLKFPTLREMHQAKAVGTTKEAKVDKTGLYIGAKVVNKDAWELVKEGVYKAFSIGGDVVKRVGNVIQELDLIEISLVDVPANKAAVIELWKRGKVSKGAETAYTMANLMIQVKDTISYYKWLGKDTKQLGKILEELKQALAVEASESEKDYEARIEALYSEGGMWGAKTDQDLQKKMDALKAINFGNNTIANLIREGVINKMAKKLEKKVAPDESEETKTEEETTEDAEETEEDKSEETEEKTEEPKAEDSEEDAAEADTEEKGEIAMAMQKVVDASKKLDKVAPVEKTEVKTDKEITKAIGSMAGSLVKMTETIVGLADRIAVLEKTPAAAKSKSAVVLKTTTTGEDSTEEVKDESSDLVAKRARLAELNKMFDSMGASKFAKGGYSKEAMQLMKSIEALTK